MSSEGSLQKCGNSKCEKTSESTAMRKCSRCKVVSYCSQACQAASWPTHKEQCYRQNYIVKFELAPEHIKDPPVWRTLSCPANALFYHLHMALQVAFGWATTHSFDFAVANPNYEPPDNLMDLVQHKMMRDNMGLEMDQSMPQEYLFRVVDPTPQSPVSGIDRMHEGFRRHPNTREKKADDYELHKLFDDPKYQGRQIIYTYDFGDSWEHVLTIIGRVPSSSDFVCLDGSGHPVAEDAGGVCGWESLKAAYRAPNPSEEQRERRAWYENMCTNYDAGGLAGDCANKWDRAAVNWGLDRRRLLAKFERMAKMDEAQMDMYEEAMRRGRGRGRGRG